MHQKYNYTGFVAVDFTGYWDHQRHKFCIAATVRTHVCTYIKLYSSNFVIYIYCFLFLVMMIEFFLLVFTIISFILFLYSMLHFLFIFLLSKRRTERIEIKTVFLNSSEHFLSFLLRSLFLSFFCSPSFPFLPETFIFYPILYYCILYYTFLSSISTLKIVIKLLISLIILDVKIRIVTRDLGSRFRTCLYTYIFHARKCFFTFIFIYRY